jgi:ring-1,2-phenylacetyl-CoA epoxidase subunit PaaE
MPSGFYKLKVGKINRETADAVSIALMVPPPFKKQFEYKAGQYLTFSILINGEEVRRSYSVCSSPFEDPMPNIAVKEVPRGKMSTYLNRNLKEGDLLDVMPPMGKFILEPDAASAQHYFLFGGGSGITPLKSILLTLLGQEPNSTATLLYANRNEASVIFKKELEALEQEFSSRFQIIWSYDEAPENWSGMQGMLNPDKIKAAVQQYAVNHPNDAEYYICGPSGMMDVVKNGLKLLNIADEKIHTEYFTAVVKESSDDNMQQEADELDALIPASDRRVKVELFGMNSEITVKPGQTILEAAQDAGLDPPYSCTVGVCTTCRARLKSGKVSMDEREGLSDAEIDQGYILTCQSHPTTDDVDLVYE